MRHGRMAGNFPQAFSHLAFIGAAHALAEAHARGRSEGDSPIP